jgi:tetratricopeptide (TPR) repeat protein
VPKQSALARWVVGPLRAIARRPVRSLAIILLVALFCFGSAIGVMHVRAWYHFRAGRDAVQHYHAFDGLEHLQVCLSVWPNDPDSLTLMARSLRRLELFDQAEECLERARGMRGKSADPILERMLLRLARGETDQLEKLCQSRVEQNDPDSGLILEALIHGAIRTYQIRKAGFYIQRWLDLEPDNPQPTFLRGFIFEYMSLRQEAASMFRRVLELDPEHDEARLHLSTQLLDLLRGGEAIPHLEYLQARRPENLRVPILIAQCKDQIGQHAEAEAILDEVLVHSPDFAPALSERSKMALRDGHTQQAEAWLRRASRVESGDYTIHYMLYQCLVQNGKAQEAEEIQKRLKQIEDDITHLRDIISYKMQESPRDVALHYEAGMVAMRSGSFKEALRWFKSALKIEPNHAPTLRALADFYQRIGQLGEAERHWEQALAADPEGTKAASRERETQKR